MIAKQVYAEHRPVLVMAREVAREVTGMDEVRLNVLLDWRRLTGVVNKD
ncbi:MAG: hypothetical protein V7629_13290 [Motiliproteus sp.]